MGIPGLVFWNKPALSYNKDNKTFQILAFAGGMA